MSFIDDPLFAGSFRVFASFVVLDKVTRSERTLKKRIKFYNYFLNSNSHLFVQLVGIL